MLPIRLHNSSIVYPECINEKLSVSNWANVANVLKYRVEEAIDMGGFWNSNSVSG